MVVVDVGINCLGRGQSGGGGRGRDGGYALVVTVDVGDTVAATTAIDVTDGGCSQGHGRGRSHGGGCSCGRETGCGCGSGRGRGIEIRGQLGRQRQCRGSGSNGNIWKQQQWLSVTKARAKTELAYK